MRDEWTRVVIRALAFASLLSVAVLVWRAQALHGVDPTPSSSETARVVVAGADLTPGMRLAPGIVQTAEWPRSELPPGAFASIEALEGRVLRHPVPRGQPILESFLLPRIPVQIVAV